MSTWTENEVEQLEKLVGNSDSVTYTRVEEIATKMDRSTRSISGKLRALNYEVGRKASDKESVFTDAQSEELEDFVNTNAGQFTFGEIAEQVCGGQFNSRQVQGKILALKLNQNVKPTEKATYKSAYTEEETTVIEKMANNGDTLEDIVAELENRHSVNSVRGKALSLLKQGAIQKIPAAGATATASKSDYFDGVENIEGKSVADLAEELGKTPRGVKVALTRRGISCADHTPKAKEAA